MGLRWHAQFRAGCIAVGDDDHTGRPISCITLNTVAKVQHLVHEDQHITNQELVDEVEIG